VKTVQKVFLIIAAVAMMVHYLAQRDTPCEQLEKMGRPAAQIQACYYVVGQEGN